MSTLALSVFSDWLKDQMVLGCSEYKPLYHDLKVSFSFSWVTNDIQRKALYLEHGYHSRHSKYIHGRLRYVQYVQNVGVLVQLHCFVKDGGITPVLIQIERCLCQGVCNTKYTHCSTRHLWLGPTQPLTLVSEDHHTLYNNQVNMYLISREWYFLNDPRDIMVGWLRRSMVDVEPFTPYTYHHVNFNETLILVLDVLIRMSHCPYDTVEFHEQMRLDQHTLEYTWFYYPSHESFRYEWQIEYDDDIDTSSTIEHPLELDWF